MTFLLCLLAFLAGGLTTTWAWSFIILARHARPTSKEG